MGNKILVIDRSIETREILKEILQPMSFELYWAENYDKAITLLKNHSFELIFLDMELKDNYQVLNKIRRDCPENKLIITSDTPSLDIAMLGLRTGVLDYLPKPFNYNEVRKSIEKAISKSSSQEHTDRLGPLIGSSVKIQSLYSQIRNVSASESNVCITGESGVGKGLVAQTIHAYSPRRNNNFVHVDCNAIAPTLFETELFGHIKGAYSGAVRDRVGAFRNADGGIIFLDEIGELSQEIQVKLLRAIDEKKIKPVGSDRTYEIDVRIITATNRDMSRAVLEKKIREDFFYRIYVVSIEVPPLREHSEDIPLLIEHFIEKLNSKKKRKKTIDKHTIDVLCKYHWPGNVRELENIVEHTYTKTGDNIITIDDLPSNILDKVQFETPIQQSVGSLKELEKNCIYEALEKTAGNRTRAAQLLGIDRKTLYRKLLQYKIEEKSNIPHLTNDLPSKDMPWRVSATQPNR